MDVSETRKHPSRVFISYAREDERAAQRLYEALSGYSELDVWFDRQSLLPGADWKLEIDEAIRQADCILVLLSHKSVSKTGYVQREIREAVERLALLPPGGRLVIPVRLTDCEVRHRGLRDLSWVDLFPVWSIGLAKLLLGLGVHAPRSPSNSGTHYIIAFGNDKYAGLTELVELSQKLPDTLRSEVEVPPLRVSLDELPPISPKHVYPKGLESGSSAESVYHRLWSSSRSPYYRKSDWGRLWSDLFGGGRDVHTREKICETFRRLWLISRETQPELERNWQTLYDLVFEPAADFFELERRQQVLADRRREENLLHVVNKLKYSQGKLSYDELKVIMNIIMNDMGGLKPLAEWTETRTLMRLYWSLNNTGELSASGRRRMTEDECRLEVIRVARAWTIYRTSKPAAQGISATEGQESGGG